MHETLASLAYRHAILPDGPSIPRVSLHVARETSWPIPTLYRPMLGIVLRGAKRVTIGDRTLRYGTNHYFVGSIDVPASSAIIEASADAPYVAARLEIDQDLLSELVVDVNRDFDGETTAFAIGVMTSELLDAWYRMLRLLDAPNEIDVLAPLIEREIMFRILQGPQGALLRQAARADSRISQVRNTIAHLRANFDRRVRTEELVEITGMSAATFHRHFRSVTAMSPLQYQKALRLQEARRRLIAGADPMGAAFSVGYESASQFSREYTRMFGTPPARDAARLRASKN
ncbi:AraC family transcriptional regulator [Paraburkholderia agricolaris]|uniref:AraC family transcriptional regulator n=1 Tax=Paraburkholderia agricolaris TaxID=2152888 RepID=UPI0038B72D3C